MTVVAAQSTSFYPLVERPVTRRLVLDNGCVSGYSEDYIQPKQVFLNPDDGKYYLYFTGTGTSGVASCVATATSPLGPFTAAQVIVVNAVYGWIISDGAGTWWLFANNAGTSLAAWKSTTGVTGTWSSVGTVLNKEGAGSWDSHEIDEACVIADPRPGHSGYLMFFMGAVSATGDGGLATGTPQTEQVGLATASTLAGTWTRVTSIATPPFSQSATTGLIIPCSGSSGDPDGAEVSDPTCLYINGVFYLFASATWWGGAGNAYLMLWTATDPINGPWTRRGIALERSVWPSNDACTVNTGNFYSHTDGNVYYTYEASQTQRVNPQKVAQSNAYQAALDPASFWYGPHTALWKRVEAESGDSRITTTGTWASEANIYSSGDGDIFSSTTSATISFQFSGRRVRVGAQAHASNAIVQVALDGVNQGAAVDTYSNDGGAAAAATPCLIYDSGEISPGSHTVKLTRTGTNPSSTSPGNVVADYFEYIAL